MPELEKLVRIPTLKTVADFRNHVVALGLDLPCEDSIVTGADSPLKQPLNSVTVNGKVIGNRIAIQPMEGWDGTTSGRITDNFVGASSASRCFLGVFKFFFEALTAAALDEGAGCV